MLSSAYGRHIASYKFKRAIQPSPHDHTPNVLLPVLSPLLFSSNHGSPLIQPNPLHTIPSSSPLNNPLQVLWVAFLEMRKLIPSFVVNGGIKLPIGYRFCPTDEELVIHYLKRKAFSHPLPASVIPDFDVFALHPRHLPGVGDSKEKGYFFSHRKDGIDDKRPAGSGYWKTTGRDRQIIASDSNEVVGVKKTLVFCEGKRSREARTRWVMHELRLPSHPSQHMEATDWALYRVFQKRKLKRKGSNSQLSNSSKVQRLEEEIKPSFIDFTVEYGSDNGPPPPSSPSLSEGNEIASNKLD